MQNGGGSQIEPSPDRLATVAFSFIQHSRTLTRVSDVASALQRIIEPLGMTAAASGMVSGPRAASGNPFHFTNWSAGWIETYIGSDFLLSDPLPRWARSSGRALTWSALFRILPPRDPGRQVVEAAARFGYNEGIPIPMRAADNALGLVAFGGPGPTIGPAEEIFLTLVGRAAFEAAERIEQNGATGRVAPTLTTREIECLALLVRGHSDRQIGGVMGISEPTVRFHIGNARTKYNAVSRTHLAALAAVQGYVNL